MYHKPQRIGNGRVGRGGGFLFNTKMLEKSSQEKQYLNRDLKEGKEA